MLNLKSALHPGDAVEPYQRHLKRHPGRLGRHKRAPVVGIAPRRQRRGGGGDPCEQRGLDGPHLGHLAIREGVDRQVHLDDDAVCQHGTERRNCGGLKRQE